MLVPVRPVQLTSSVASSSLIKNYILRKEGCKVRVQTPTSCNNLSSSAGLCAGQVRAIFYLPEHIAFYPHPLLYVRWFRPFRGPEPNSGLYVTSRSTRNQSQRHSIVCASTLLRPCHLMPKYGQDDVDPEWTSSNVLDMADDFLLNTYLDYHMFHMLTPACSSQ